MAVLVCLHAHPDDEVMSTGGTMMKAVDEGHTVVLVTATGGECGEYPEGFLAEGETLKDRRSIELDKSVEILGIHKLVRLGYRDSGMIGTEDNQNPDCFWQADVELAATKLAEILVSLDSDVLTVYDDHGGYGHPDHIQVHRVGIRAAEIAGIKRVFQASMNRDLFKEFLASAPRDDGSETEGSQVPDLDEFTIGTPESDLNVCVDVVGYVDRKREALLAHASQIPEDSWFQSLPEELVTRMFSREWFIYGGVDGEKQITDLFDPSLH